MFYDRFRQLCERKGISCNKAALEIGLSNATPTKWKKTGATPVGDTLDKIAAYFGVTTDYLLGKETKKAPTSNKADERIRLTQEEADLIAEYRKLTEARKEAIRLSLRAYQDSE